MALTTVALAASDVLPTVAGSATFDTTDGNGFTFTKSDFPATWITLYSDNDFYFHQTNAQTAGSSGNMQKVPAGVFYPIMIGKTRSIYCKTATGSATVVVTETTHEG